MITPNDTHTDAGPDTEPLFPKIHTDETQPVHDEAPDILKLRELARDLQESLASSVDKYVSVCEHIRTAQLMPVTVTNELRALGFVESRISEIKRVALVSDEVWQQYKSRAIGFKVTLELARKEDRDAKQELENRQSVMFSAEVPPVVSEAPAKPIETPSVATPSQTKGKGKEPVKTKPERTDKAVPLAPAVSVKSSPEDGPLKSWFESMGFLWYLKKNLPASGKLPATIKPSTNFNVNGWAVELRIVRKTQTKKPAKKTNKTKGKK